MDPHQHNTPHRRGGRRRRRRTCRGARGWRRGMAGQRADAPNHQSAHPAPLVWRAPEGPEGQAAVPVGGGRWRGLARQHTETPTDWRPPRGLRGLAGLRADAPSEARGADGERAGRPRGGRRSVGATSSNSLRGRLAGGPPPTGASSSPARQHPQRHEAATGFPATASSRSRSAVHNGATSDQAVMST